ncbi:hypothetical protein F2Q69_00021305 [Brassica cretica]|uniref:Uncharacterized protein n=1 Tax=Brassica cretica TaxID=69181 RepID=A0A8S9Q979_BRACR|nr:hypothetical protein F2Q69_00021305 [Brassica cretica]
MKRRQRRRWLTAEQPLTTACRSQSSAIDLISQERQRLLRISVERRESKGDKRER